MLRVPGVVRMPLLQINGVRVGCTLSPVKRSWTAPQDRTGKENQFDDCEVVGLSPFKKRSRTCEPVPLAAITQFVAPLPPRPLPVRPSKRSVVAMLVERFPDLRIAIDALPVEVVAYIFTFLEPEELLRASIVCRTWYQICDFRALWARHFLYPDEQPLQSTCRWPGRWAHYKRQTLAEEARRDHDELFCRDYRLDRYEEMARLREAFRELDQFTLMEQ